MVAVAVVVVVRVRVAVAVRVAVRVGMTDSFLAILQEHAEDSDQLALFEVIARWPADRVPLALWEVQKQKRRLSIIEKSLEARAAADGLKEWTAPDGARFGFWGSLRKGFKDLPNVLSNIHSYGVSLESIFGAITDIRVTDLREAAELISNPNNRSAALSVIEDGRIPKGERGDPHLVSVDAIGSKKP